MEEWDFIKLDISSAWSGFNDGGIGSYQTRHILSQVNILMTEESDLIKLDISSAWSGFNDGGVGSYQTRHILSLVRI